jgi:hypothetical protein
MTSRGIKKTVVRSPVPRPPLVVPVPTPAWRYERAEGYRKSIVRIYCRNEGVSGDIGSGVFIQWNGWPVVLTARHVVKDAKSIDVEFFEGRKTHARVLHEDAMWDAAVLEPIGNIEGISPAEIEFGNAAMQNAGDRLESCGYGPDGRLACNHGLFVGYRRSSQSLAGPDDWMVVSGHARQGDSGGPIFNRNGRIIGVIWGTDGETVIGVQAGRLHLLLDAAVRPSERNPAPHVPNPTSLVRIPTPAKEADATVNADYGCAVGGTCDLAAAKKKEPLLKWRRETQNRDDAQDARIEALIELQERQVHAANPTPAANGSDAKIAASDSQDNEKSSPLIAAVCIAGSIGIASALYFLTAKSS